MRYDDGIVIALPSRTIILALVAAAAAGACARKSTAPPVATVSLVPSKPRVALDAPVEFAYRFDMAPGASIPGDYRVFVHVNGADGKMLWSDDHDPPIPTSQWKPGQPIQYTRSRFVPVVPYVGDTTIEMGLYKDKDRLPLQGADPSDRNSPARSYKVATLQLLPRSESIYLAYKTGWYSAEFAPEDPSNSWQWSGKSATIDVRNPQKDVTFMVEYDARPDLFPGQPQQVTVYAGTQAVGTFSATATAPAIERLPISAAQLGSGDTAQIRIDVDRTFVPARQGGGDTRELGIRVYHAYVEGR